MSKPPSNATEIPVMPAYLSSELTRCACCSRIVASDSETVSEYWVLIFRTRPGIKQAICRLCLSKYSKRSLFIGEGMGWILGDKKTPEPHEHP